MGLSVLMSICFGLDQSCSFVGNTIYAYTLLDASHNLHFLPPPPHLSSLANNSRADSSRIFTLIRYHNLTIILKKKIIFFFQSHVTPRTSSVFFF